MKKFIITVDVEVQAVDKMEARNVVLKSLEDNNDVLDWDVTDISRGTIGDNTRDMCIEELDFSVRTYNCLKRAGINTVNDLVNNTEEEILEIRNLGSKNLEEIKRELLQQGLWLRE